MKIIKKKRVKASALLGAILVLATAILFLDAYQQASAFSMKNNLMLIEYFDK